MKFENKHAKPEPAPENKFDDHICAYKSNGIKCLAPAVRCNTTVGQGVWYCTQHAKLLHDGDDPMLGESISRKYMFPEPVLGYCPYCIAKLVPGMKVCPDCDWVIISTACFPANDPYIVERRKDAEERRGIWHLRGREYFEASLPFIAKKSPGLAEIAQKIYEASI